jgi:hypothetical protein
MAPADAKNARHMPDGGSRAQRIAAMRLQRHAFNPNALPLLLFLAVGVALAGCSAYGTRTVPRVSRQHLRGHQPEYNVISVAQIGEVIYAEFDYIETHQEADDKAILDDGFEWSRWNGQHVSIEPGYALVAVITGRGTEYCTTEPRFRDILGPPHLVVCFGDTDADGLFDKMTAVAPIPYRTDIVPTRYRATADPPRRTETPIDGFKKELVYQGQAAGILTIRYREYSDNLARPAFFQDINYDYSDGAIVAFQSVRVEALSADNVQLKYRVLAGWRK